MTFEEWQMKHGPNWAAYDIEMQRAGWDGALAHQSGMTDDLVTLVRRLVKQLRKAAPDNKLPATAMDYLEHNGFNSGPLRSAKLFATRTEVKNGAPCHVCNGDKADTQAESSSATIGGSA